MIDQYGLYGEGQGPRSVLEEAFEGVVIGKVTKKKLQLNASWEYKLDPEEVIKYGGITLIISENMQKKWLCKRKMYDGKGQGRLKSNELLIKLSDCMYEVC